MGKLHMPLGSALVLGLYSVKICFYRLCVSFHCVCIRSYVVACLAMYVRASTMLYVVAHCVVHGILGFTYFICGFR